MLSSILVARMLGSAAFGRFGIVQATLVTFQDASAAGLSLAVTKFVAERRAVDAEGTGRMVGVAIVTAAAISAALATITATLASLIATRFLAAPALAHELRIICLAIVLGALNSVMMAAVAGLERFSTIAWLNLAAGVLGFPVIVAGARINGVRGAVWGSVGSLVIAVLLGASALRRLLAREGMKIHFRGGSRDVVKLLALGLPATAASAIVGPALWIAAAVLANTATGYHQVGLFNAANQWRTAILFVPVSLAPVLLPILTSYRNKGAQATYRKILAWNSAAALFFALPVAAAVAAASPIIMRSYGAGFEGGVPALIVLAIAATVVAVDVVIGQSIASAGRMWAGFLFNLGWALILVSLSLWLAPSMGAVGVAWATLGAYLAHLFAQAWFVLHELRGIPRRGVETGAA